MHFKRNLQGGNMDTKLINRGINKPKNKDIVTVYKLTINDHKSIKEFITLQVAEVGIKAIEVLQDNDLVEIAYEKIQTSYETYVDELKRICECI